MAAAPRVSLTVTGNQVGYVVQGQQQTTTMQTPRGSQSQTSMGSPMTGRSSLKPGQVQSSLSLVPTVHTELQIMEATIRNLQEENESLKHKLLMNRKSSFEKYFMASGNLAVQACFHEWDRVYKELKAERERDGLNSMRSQDRAEYMARLEQLQQRVKELSDLLAQTRREADNKQFQLQQKNMDIQGTEHKNAQISAKNGELESEWEKAQAELKQQLEMEALRKQQLGAADALIHSLQEQAAAYQFVTNPTLGSVTVPQVEQISHIKGQLHKILKETDEKYLPPLAAPAMPSLSAMPAPAPAPTNTGVFAMQSAPALSPRGPITPQVITMENAGQTTYQGVGRRN